MFRTMHFYLCCGLLSCSSVFAQQQATTTLTVQPQEQQTLSMDEQNVVGHWQCQANTPTQRYTTEISAKANRSYTDHGTSSILVNGKWVTVNYKGAAQWAVEPNKTLTLSNYRTTDLQLNHLNPQEKQQAKKAISSPLSRNGKIVRLGAKMLVVEFKDHRNTTVTSRCTKKSV